MSTLAVARKDFTDAIRSRALWAISALFVLLIVGVAVAYASFPDALAAGNASSAGLNYFLASVISTFVAITAILIGYKSIAGERESGSILLTLALPHSRRDVVLGKVLGRTGVLAVPVVGALALGTVAGGSMLGEFAPVATLAMLVVSLLFVLTYVSIVVGLSAMTAASDRAAALAVGFFFAFEMLWSALSFALVFVTNGFAMPDLANFPDWTFLVNLVPPSSAFLTTVSAALPGVSSSVGEAGTAAADVDAFFGTPWLGALVLLVWLIVPVAIGLSRFERADL